LNTDIFTLVKKLATALTFFLAISLGTTSSTYASNEGMSAAAYSIDKWLDPALCKPRTNTQTMQGDTADYAQAHKAAREKILEILGVWHEERILPISPNQEHEDYGLSFPPDSDFDLSYLAILRANRLWLKRPISTVDLGCGPAKLAVLSVFAGAVVDAVDFKETLAKVKILERFKFTQEVIGYETKDWKQYYCPQACDLTNANAASQPWLKKPHDIAVCSNLIHFFSDGALELLIKRLFNNLTPGGTLFILTDTPFDHPIIYDFYISRIGKTRHPGLAVYNREGEVEGKPIAYDAAIHKTVKPGCTYPGALNYKGEVLASDTKEHFLRNLFLMEELVSLFKAVGFEVADWYYINANGGRLMEPARPVVGQHYKLALTLSKPVKP
jgi:hypothetical protein